MSGADNVSQTDSDLDGIGDVCNAGWAALGDGPDSLITALQLTPDGNLVVAGVFDSVEAFNMANNIAVWDGATWALLGGGIIGAVRALTVWNGGLVAAGSFSQAGTQSANNCAFWDGTAWSPLGTGTDGTVSALTVHDGNLVAGGDFAQAGGKDSSKIDAAIERFYELVGA